MRWGLWMAFVAFPFMIMQTVTNTFAGIDQKEIFYHQWLPDDGSKLQAIVQIAHGMAEHSQRYHRFAEVLTKEGMAVYANDHRGHGKTAGDLSKVGYFEEGSFWEKTLEDLHTFNQLIRNAHPGVPIFLLGHSMGSMLWRHYIAQYPEPLQGVILSGTGGDPGFIGKVGVLVAQLQTVIRSRKVRSKTLNAMAFGAFNNHFKPNRTEFDWLSRDESEVDKYVADDYCGGVFTAGFFVDLLKGVNTINSTSNYRSTPKGLPIYLVAGSQDPVGDMSKGVQQVFKAYQKTGMESVNCKIYPNARHEVLNEVNREEVVADLVDWFKSLL